MPKNQCVPAAPVAADCTTTPNSPLAKDTKEKAGITSSLFFFINLLYLGYQFCKIHWLLSKKSGTAVHCANPL
jgi:hypothetical protein